MTTTDFTSTIKPAYTPDINTRGRELMAALQQEPDNQLIKNDIITLLLPQVEYIARKKAREFRNDKSRLVDKEECISGALEGIENVLKDPSHYDPFKSPNFHSYMYAAMDNAIIDRWRKITHHGSAYPMKSLDKPVGARAGKQMPYGNLLPTHDLSPYDLQFRELLDQARQIIRNAFGEGSGIDKAFNVAIQGVLEGKTFGDMAKEQGKSINLFRYYLDPAMKYIRTTHPEIADQLSQILSDKNEVAGSYKR